MGASYMSCGVICLLLCLHSSLGSVKEDNARKIPPPGKDGYPIEVESSMYILDVSDVNEKTTEFTMLFYFRQSWNDERLKFSGTDSKLLTNSELDEIWKPDLFFVEELHGKLHSLTVPNIFARHSPNGTILYSMRLTMTFRCAMDLRYYPHDTQSCKFHIESYGSTANKIKLLWKTEISNPAVMITENIDLPDFKVSAVEYNEDVVSTQSNTYSRLNVGIIFERKIGFFMTKIFGPYILLVLASWLGFWIHPRFVVQRLSFILAILVLMMVVASDFSDHVPEASYTKGIDVWINFCITLVFVSFLEFLFVSIAMGKPQSSESSDQPIMVSGMDLESNEKKLDEGKCLYFGRKVAPQGLFKASNLLDSVLRITYPIIFAFFNLVYWCYYAS